MHPHIRILSVAIVLSLLLGGVMLSGRVGAQGSTPEFPPPTALPQGSLSEAMLRDQLITQKRNLCNDLQLIAGIIVSTGILSEVPTTISQLTGLPIDELEARETAACQPQAQVQPGEQETTAALLDEVRTVEYLIHVHLAAMDAVLLQTATFRPINAEGSFAGFLEMHNISVKTMRDLYLALEAEPTLANARALAAFWQDSLIPHAEAEDRALWPLARSVGDAGLTHAADLLQAEHGTIEEGIARYLDRLQAVENGQVPASELVAIARDVRIRTELHFGKEEESVIRPLQRRLTSEQFQPVVEGIDQAIGPWLRERGWSWPAASH